MKKLLALSVLATIFLFTSSGFKPAEGLSWKSWNDGSAQAAKEGKVVMMDVYTSWCGWCKVMEKNTFSDPGVIEQINKSFIPVKFNPETPGLKYTYKGKEYTDGESFATAIGKNQITGYPAIVFYYPKTGKVKVEIGYRDAEAFKKVLKQMEQK